MTAAPPILLVDDNAHDVELALDALGQCELPNPVIVVRDGAQALDFLFRRGAYAQRTAQQPIFVLLDLKMPKVNGHEVLAQVRADPAFDGLPIVLMTSSREEADLAKGYALGANAYIVKPVAFDESRRAIHDLGEFWGKWNQRPGSP